MKILLETDLTEANARSTRRNRGRAGHRIRLPRPSISCTCRSWPDHNKLPPLGLLVQQFNAIARENFVSGSMLATCCKCWKA